MQSEVDKNKEMEKEICKVREILNINQFTNICERIESLKKEADKEREEKDSRERMIDMKNQNSGFVKSFAAMQSVVESKEGSTEAKKKEEMEGERDKSITATGEKKLSAGNFEKMLAIGKRIGVINLE